MAFTKALFFFFLFRLSQVICVCLILAICLSEAAHENRLRECFLRPAKFMYLIPSPSPAKSNFSSFAPDSVFGVLRELAAWFSEASDHDVLPGLHEGLSTPNPLLQAPFSSVKASLWAQAVVSCQGVFSQLGLQADQAFIPGPLTLPHTPPRKFPHMTAWNRKLPSKWVDELWQWEKSPAFSALAFHSSGDNEMDRGYGVRKLELKSWLKPQILGLWALDLSEPVFLAVNGELTTIPASYCRCESQITQCIV